MRAREISLMCSPIDRETSSIMFELIKKHNGCLFDLSQVVRLTYEADVIRILNMHELLQLVQALLTYSRWKKKKTTTTRDHKSASGWYD